MTEEIWKIIPECPNYEVSNLGRIFNNKLGRFLVVSYTTEGYAKVNLINDNGMKVTRSVAKLVAEAFVEPPPKVNTLKRNDCNQVVMLDGHFDNLSADNLVWRPRWMAWLYRWQLVEPQPRQFKDLPVVNLRTGIEYKNIIEAGMATGLLFKYIWRSTYEDQCYLYPYWDVFKLI